MWLFFTIATTLLWGFAEIFYKKGARPDEKYSHLKIVVCVGFVMGAHAIFELLTENMGYDPINIIKYFPVSFCYILSMALSYFGMRFIEESISDPIENTSGALCSLLCVVFLHERISFAAALAIIAIVIGILGIGFLDNNGDTDRKKILGKKMAIIAFTMPFCYAILDAVGTFMDDITLEMSTTHLVHVTEDTIETVANTSYELTFLFCAILVLAFIMSKHVKFNLPTQGDKILAAICETSGQFTYVFALSGGHGAIAAPIMSCVCVVSVILSRIILKEKLTKLQYLFIVVILLGIVTLAVLEGGD